MYNSEVLVTVEAVEAEEAILGVSLRFEEAAAREYGLV